MTGLSVGRAGAPLKPHVCFLGGKLCGLICTAQFPKYHVWGLILAETEKPGPGVFFWCELPWLLHKRNSPGKEATGTSKTSGAVACVAKTLSESQVSHPP